MVGLLDVFDQLIQTPLKLLERELGRERKEENMEEERCTEQKRLKGMRRARAPETNLCHRWPTPRGPERRV